MTAASLAGFWKDDGQHHAVYLLADAAEHQWKVLPYCGEGVQEKDERPAIVWSI